MTRLLSEQSNSQEWQTHRESCGGQQASHLCAARGVVERHHLERVLEARARWAVRHVSDDGRRHSPEAEITPN